MRRQLLFVSLLLCALTLSGWGSMAAIALCPHAAKAAAEATAEAVKMDDDHACCPSENAQKSEHCTGSRGEATGEMEAMPRTNSEPQALAMHAESCWHCAGPGSLPEAPVSMRESQPRGSESSRAASTEVKPVAPPAVRFVSAIIPAQGAPPGPPARKHLLLSVFLI